MPRTIRLDTPKGPRTICIPAGMRIEETSRVFVDVLLRTVRQGLRHHGKSLMDGVETPDGSLFVLRLNKCDDVLFWGVEGVLNKKLLAGGFFTQENGRWAEARAAAHPSVRGKGLYRAVLRRIRAFLGRPILSDTTLSAANACVWIKAGGVPDDGHGSFRINPRRKLVSSVAGCIRAMEIVWSSF